MHVRPIAHVLLVALIVALGAVVTAAAAEGGDRPTRVRTAAWPHPAPRYTVPVALDGVNVGIQAELDRDAARWYTWATDQERIAAAARDSQRRRTTSAARGTTPAIGGSCAAMKPAGFPDSIVWRESRGDPSAVNGDSGALGCAQILPSHFRGSCSGMSYAQCWSYLWAGGAGASNWACTPESGCG